MSPVFIRQGHSTTEKEIIDSLDEVAEAIVKQSPQSVLFIPPDISRLSSGAGFITSYLHDRLPTNIKKAILPATGLHRPMSESEKKKMFGDGFKEMEFFTHDPRSDQDCLTLGGMGAMDCQTVFGEQQKQWDFLWQVWDEIKVGVNKRLSEFDLILSIGQVLPHEILGMANYHKNILIGVGSEDFVNKSHFIGALIGISEITGRPRNPMRDFLREAYDRMVRPKYNIQFLFTVVDTSKQDFSQSCAGIFYGDNDDLFYQACHLSQQVNITSLSTPCDRVWVYMPSEKYHSLWLANKAIYRTQDILGEGSKLIIDAPGIQSWGEDLAMDEIISTYGYAPSEKIIATLKKELSTTHIQKERPLFTHLAVAAHLIHGYSRHPTFFVDYLPRGVAGKRFYQKVGFSSITPEEYQEEVCQTFSQKSPDDLYSHSSLSVAKSGSHDYFINDAGLGFWRYSGNKNVG